MGFVGCIRNFKINGNLFGPPTRSFGTQPCYPNVEIGAFFDAAGGHLVTRKYSFGFIFASLAIFGMPPEKFWQYSPMRVENQVFWILDFNAPVSTV